MRAFIFALALVFTRASQVSAETFQENWSSTANLDDNWVVQNRAGLTVSNGRLVADSPIDAVVIQHKTIRFRRDRVASVSGWIQSNDLKTTRWTYFAAGLQSINDGNFYGTAALANKFDERNGFYKPSWIIFTNEWDGTLWTTESPWWAVVSTIKKNIDGQHSYKVERTPSNSDGSRGVWKLTLDGKTFTSRSLPMDANFRPIGGFGQGRSTFGPMTMTGTLAS